MPFKNLKYSVERNVAVIEMSTPHNLNALSADMIRELNEAVERCKEDENVKAVILKGAGKAFSGGGDIAEMKEKFNKGENLFLKTVEPVARLSQRLKKLEKPVVAAVHGAVAGGAFNVVLACDLIIAAEGTKFVQAFTGIGLVPDSGGMYLLSRAVGVNRAMQMALLNNRISVEEAKDLGIVCQICPTDTLDETAYALVAKLAEGPSLAYAYIKRLNYISNYADFDQYIYAEMEAQYAAGRSEDFMEGITAFLEKRTPQFKGM